MIWFAVTAVLVLGVSTICWACVGLARAVMGEAFPDRDPRWLPAEVAPEDVAVIIAARNEELVLPATLAAVRKLLPGRQIFVVSDASSDSTVELARAAGARVMELVHNRGKAGALVAGLRHFDIPGRFAVVLLLDADTHLSADYLSSGLPLFNGRDVVAVAGRAATLNGARAGTRTGRVLLAHRERTYVAVQTLHKYGQAAGRANAVTIVPGFASMYRTEILHEVDIAAPGLAIEDYNMTFEIHTKRLGRVAFDPGAAVAYTQDPDSLSEYVRQMDRWSLGFWQTTMRHRIRPDVFWAGLLVFVAEIFLASLLLVLVVPVLVVLLLAGLLAEAGFDPGGLASGTAAVVPVTTVLAGIVVPDLMLSLYAAVMTRNLRFVAYAPAFLALRVVDSMSSLRALVRAFRGGSSGVWRSPVRR
ncbi:glycosyltransferase family 2 protein [Aeromicrobium sp. Leaf350]|uniref:glycosyltransferase family 2 protein n=1 Tax=Aeromicrobium sp. Leaf350 TaxID=2876565 RepID=UPI001E56C02B|nr:glycosyltransferase family 2 protein [Aeromicrobium sp. Leaf350]